MTSLLRRVRPAPGKPPGRPSDLGWRILAAVAVALLAGALLWSMGAERRAIHRMAPAERRAVYAQAFGELQQLCGSGPRDDALEARCGELIRFVVQFPECDAPCQAIVRSHTPLPTK